MKAPLPSWGPAPPPLVEASPRDNHSACSRQNPGVCPTSTEDGRLCPGRPRPKTDAARLWGGKDARTPRAETPAGRGRNHSVRLQRLTGRELCARHRSDAETHRRAGDGPCSQGTSLLSEERREHINKRLIRIPEKTGRGAREGVARTGPGMGGALGEGVARTRQGREDLEGVRGGPSTPVLVGGQLAGQSSCPRGQQTGEGEPPQGRGPGRSLWGPWPGYSSERAWTRQRV